MINAELRQQLHNELDEVLDFRRNLEGENAQPVNALAGLGQYHTAAIAQEDRYKAIKLFRQAIAFASRVIGQPTRDAVIERTYQTDDQARRVLASWIQHLRPILQLPPKSLLGLIPDRELTTFGVEHALKALNAGEVQPIFRPVKGKNRRANRYSLAQAKLEALIWEKRLRALGHHTKDAKHMVTVAFGEQWDTIRKWHAQCQDILGADSVRFSLEFSGSSHDRYLSKSTGLLGALSRPDPAKYLGWAGDEYKRERARSAELSKRKSKAADQ